MMTTRPTFTRLFIFGGMASLFVVLTVVFQPRQSPAGPETPVRAPSSHATAEIDAISLGQLVGRRYTLDLWGTPDGVRYTVLDARGTVLAESLTFEEVGDRFEDVPLDTTEFGLPVELMWVDPDDGVASWSDPATGR
ncbi:MAG: hypothetical protein KDA25_09920 [Phycisphaerales bacterium]|nr:hypothetical protein [Phycisphaerales bacterium]